MIVRGRGAITTARRGKPIPMCWYCGSYTGHIVTQPDGNLLHEGCQEPSRRDYPNRVPCDGEQTDAKVRWNDQRDWEDDAGVWRV